MFKRSGHLLSIGRERAQRRVLSDEFEQIGSSLKVSKIPSGFVSFDNIECLRPRELAYTAHLAHRLGMENESLWRRIHGAVMESIGFRAMRPKYITQCVVSLSAKSDLLSRKDIDLIVKTIGERVEEFRAMDLVLVLHALASSDVQACSINPMTKYLGRCDLSQLTPKSVAVLVASLGKLKVNDPPLLQNCVALVKSHSERFNQYEIAGIIRSFSVLIPMTKVNSSEMSRVVENLITSTDMTLLDAGCINILLHAFFALSKCDVNISQNSMDRIFSQLTLCLMTADSNLLPHLLLGIAQLVSEQSCEKSGTALGVRLASTINRQYSQFKAIALPVAVKAVEILCDKFASNKDFPVLLASLKKTTERVIDQYLILAPEEERRQVLSSKYCQYSDWLRDKLVASLPSDSAASIMSVPAIIEAITQRRDISLFLQYDAKKEVVHAMDPETAAKALFLLPRDYSVAVETLLGKATSENPRSDLSFSLLFRYFLNSSSSADYRIEKLLCEFKTVSDQCDIKTLARSLHVAILFSPEHTSSLSIHLIKRIREVATEDLLPVLRLLKKAHISFDDLTKPESAYLDSVEAKLAVELNQVKSVSRREVLHTAALAIGVSAPTDLMDEYENELSKDRTAKHFISSK